MGSKMVNNVWKTLAVASLLTAVVPVAFGQEASTGTATLGPSDFGKMSEYYEYGMQQWMLEAQKAKAAGDTDATVAATRKQMAYQQAMEVAKIAEIKGSLTGAPVKALPTPGLVPVPPENNAGGIEVVGELDADLNLHNTGYEPTYMRVYKDYFYGINYWLNRATEAKTINDSAEIQTALRNAEAFENAYLALKNAEMKAEAAGTTVQVTPVAGLPRYPAVPTDSIAGVPASGTPNPSVAASPALAPPAPIIATPIAPAAAVAPSKSVVNPLPNHYARHLAPKAEFTPVAAEMPTAASTGAPAPQVAVADDDDAQSTGGRVFTLQDRTFSLRTRTGTWLVEFGATWCGPCKIMKPIMDELASEMGNVKFGAVDIDRSNATARRHRVRSVPTFVLIKDGVVVATDVGAMSKEKLKAFATQ
jgi:thioredoxin 1